MPEGVSISEAGRRLGKTPATVRKWIDLGDLRTWTGPGGRREVSVESIERLLSERAKALTDSGE